MSLGARTALLFGAIAAFTAAALVAVWLATQPRAPDPASAAAEVAPSPSATPAAVVPPATLPPEVGIAAPPEWRAQHPTVPVPVPNATAPIAAPPPAGIPSDPAEREDAILRARRNRFADQMERLNRRTQERGGKPSDAGARPPPSLPPPGSSASRRSSLSATD